jgi:hypothetical protein
MNESVLREFFIGRATGRELAADLEDSLVRSTAQSTYHPIEDMDDEFQVRSEHLIRLCDAILAGEIDPWKLQPIGFCLIASDAFEWDGNTDDGNRVGHAVHNWSASEINYQLSLATVAKFRHRLATGESTFTRADFGSGSP